MRKSKCLKPLLAVIALATILFAGCGLSEVDDFTLTILKNDENGGSIHTNPGGNNFAEGTEVKLTATPAEGWYFSEWQGDLTGSENPGELVMDGEKEVTAIFKRLDFPLAINTEGEGEVQIIEVIQPQSEEYPNETVVRLKADPGEGWHFLEWQGDLTGSENPGELVMEGEKEVTAVFVMDPDGTTGFAGGDGTEENPFLVGTAEHLNNIRNHLDKNFKQIADIDLSVYSSGEGWKPIWNFTGVLDGNNYTISNLFINRPNEEFVGLFGLLESWVKIKNVRLTSIMVTGGGRGQGGLAGHNSHGTIIDCYANGIVKGEIHVGGLVGRNSGNIINCYASVDVTGDKDVGGLVGRHAGNTGGEITQSSATGNVIGFEEVAGGLVGFHYYGDITQSYATGNVSGKIAGGLVGRNSFRSNIENSYATGNVVGSYVGALVGFNESASNISKIKNSYATGIVIGKDLGGLVSSNDGGGITASYWNIDTSGQEESAGGEGRTTLQMQAGTPGDFIKPDGTEDSEENPDNLMYDQWDDTIWDFGTKEEYPILQWQD